MKRYNPTEIEPKWQHIWDETQIYTTDITSTKPKYVAMSMFNYPSGAGIHIGHAMNYTISDVMARYKRQQGYESYHPVGWDAFGLPAENYAIKTGISPQESMSRIIPSYHSQYKAMGWSNDWSKEISTHLPEYYRWTQWIFAEMYRHGLAYQDARMQWWCTKCQTVLANEQVIDGKCWRHDAADDPDVAKKEVKQWFFKITEYADELLEATDALDWSEVVKTAQKNWIGRSVGAEVEFALANSRDRRPETVDAGESQADIPKSTITVFTTRPDTLFGATFLVLAPEHELVESLATAEQSEAVKQYVKQSLKKSEVERQSEGKEKTGVFTGSYAINPMNGAKLPIWIADYVLGGYGTGAIMAVPAHDERDNEFAKIFDLPIVNVVARDFGVALPDCKDVSGVNVIGYDPDTKRFMGLYNNNTKQAWLVSGGREEGEDYDVVARRELAEEAGYHDVKELIQLGPLHYSYYYNDNKKSNRRASGYNYLAIISEREQAEKKNESHEDFEVRWQTANELRKGIETTKGGVEHCLYGIDEAVKAAKAYNDKATYEADMFAGDGILFNSGQFDSVNSAEARDLIVQHLEREGLGQAKTTYKIRDWSVSRQRYWGAPIPIVNCPKDGAVLVPDDQLPVVLPELDDYAPSGDGRSALARATDWLHTTCPTCGGPAERETDTLDTYICSSWYELRYLDPKNTEKPFEPAVANRWMPIDFYNGGDHATAHLIYVRFVARFFHKLGMLDDPEPFKKFLFNGKVKAHDGSVFSKSKGNGIDPIEIINQGYGADALRTYLMFAAPLEFDSRWDPQGVPATHRFLSRIWNLTQEFLEDKSKASEAIGENTALVHVIHPAIKKVTEDLEAQKYNTAIATMMKCVNELYDFKAKNGFAPRELWQFALESLVALVAPFAPHIADELWRQLGRTNSVQRDSWPTWDNACLVSDTITIAVQVNGKVRAELRVAPDSSKTDLEQLALENDRVKEFLGGKTPTRVVIVPGRLVNVVV